MTSRPAFLRIGLLLTFGLAVAACGSDDTEGTGGGGGNASDAGDQDVQKTDADDKDAVGQDADPPDAGPCIDVTSVTGSVVDEGGNAFAGASVILCIYQEGGKALCLDPKKTDASGEFTIDMLGGSACLESAAYQVKSSDDLTRVSSYCPVDLGSGGAVSISEPAKLVQAPACTLDTLGDATQPHEITSPGGAVMTVVPDELWLFDYAYADMRVVTWDDATWGWPCFVDASNPPDGLVAFAPEIEVKSEDGLHIAFPNDAALAAGTVVDLYALGGSGTMTWDSELVDEGHWALIGEAEVSADGARIETRAGEGLPFGTWVGWKQK